MTDFLFLYEHRARELENCIYLSLFLEERGYKVRIESMASFRKKIYKPKVIIAPHLYDDAQIIFYNSSIWQNRTAKMVSMQYEQNLYQNEDEMSFHIPKGNAKKAYHVAWGQSEYDMYSSNGISEENILRVGCLGLDFDIVDNCKYLMSRDELADRTGLNKNKKWFVFFSSVSWVGRNENEVEEEFRDLYESENKTQTALVKWFEEFLEDDDYSEYLIVYRNHPSEHVDQRIRRLESIYPERFRINNQYTIRHWIFAADINATVSSTTHVDAYYMGKKCYILRPVELERRYDLATLKDAETVSSYDDFCSIFKNTNDDSQSENRSITYIYDNILNTPVVEKYVDGLETIINDSSERGTFVSERQDVKTAIIQDFLGVLCDASRIMKLSRFFRWNKKIYKACEMYEREMYLVRKDEKTYRERMKMINHGQRDMNAI